MLLSSLLLIPILGIFLISSDMSYEAASGEHVPSKIKSYKITAFVTSLVNLAVSLVIFILFDFSSNQFQFVQEHYNINFFDIYLGVDGISIYFVLLTTIIMPIAILSNWNSITENVKSYLIIMLLLETLLIAVFLVLDILLFYIFFESILPPLFLLIGLFGSSNKVRASFYLFLYTLFGSLFLLLSILTMSSIMGTTDFDALFKTNFDYTTQVFLFIGIFIAFAVKTPTIFLNNWLLKAHVESPLGGSIVLAGRTMPALNLAVCWKHPNGSISRKLSANYSKFSSTLRDDGTLNLENIEAITNCESNKLDRISRGQTLNATNFSSYLTGLIEGDGCIYVPKTGAATITIAFNSKDLPLPLLIQKEIGHGNIYKVKGKNAYTYVVSNLDGLTIIANHINGHMRTHKISSLHKLIDWINLKYNAHKKTNVQLIPEKFRLDNSCLSSNAWLAGFIESDGCFYVRVSKNNICATYKIACLFELAQKTTKDKVMLDIMTKIKEFLSTNLKFRTKSSQYWVRTSSYPSNKILTTYLSKYPLLSSKYLDFISWQKVLNIMIKKEQVKKLEEINDLKNNMNNKRSYFNWDHLKNFYT